MRDVEIHILFYLPKSLGMYGSLFVLGCCFQGFHEPLNKGKLQRAVSMMSIRSVHEHIIKEHFLLFLWVFFFWGGGMYDFVYKRSILRAVQHTNQCPWLRNPSSWNETCRGYLDELPKHICTHESSSVPKSYIYTNFDLALGQTASYHVGYFHIIIMVV